MEVFLETERLVLRRFTGADADDLFELDVRRVFAQTMAVNAASRRVMERAGLVFVRAFREEWPGPIAGAEHGEVEYALTKVEWEHREKAGGYRSIRRGAIGRNRGTP